MPIPELEKFRTKYPQYKDMNDLDVATKLADKYPDAYGDLLDKVKATSTNEKAVGGTKEAPLQFKEQTITANKSDKPLAEIPLNDDQKSGMVTISQDALGRQLKVKGQQFTQPESQTTYRQDEPFLDAQAIVSATDTAMNQMDNIASGKVNVGFNAPLSIARASLDGVISGMGKYTDAIKIAQSGDLRDLPTAISKVINGTIATAFSAATPFVPALATFTGATQVAQELFPKTTNYLTAPTQSILKPTTEFGKEMAEASDLIINLFTAAYGGRYMKSKLNKYLANNTLPPPGVMQEAINRVQTFDPKINEKTGDLQMLYEERDMRIKQVNELQGVNKEFMQIMVDKLNQKIVPLEQELKAISIEQPNAVEGITQEKSIREMIDEKAKKVDTSKPISQTIETPEDFNKTLQIGEQTNDLPSLEELKKVDVGKLGIESEPLPKSETVSMPSEIQGLYERSKIPIPEIPKVDLGEFGIEPKPLRELLPKTEPISVPEQVIELQSKTPDIADKKQNDIRPEVIDPTKTENFFGASLLPFEIKSLKDIKTNFRENTETIKNVLGQGANLIKSGLNDFGDWSKRMVDEFGDGIKPELSGLWNKVKDANKEIKADFTQQVLDYAERKGIVGLDAQANQRDKNTIEKIYSGVKQSFNESPKDVQQAKDLMLKHHEAVRDADFVSMELKKEFDNLAKDIPEDRRIAIIDASQTRNGLDRLSPKELEIVKYFDKAKADLAKYTKEAQDAGVVAEFEGAVNPHYLTQWWINPKTGKPYSAYYGQFSKGAPQFHDKTFPTYEVGRKMGMEMASTNLGEIIGVQLKGLTRAIETRSMIKAIANIDATTGEMVRGKGTKEVTPMKLMENWVQLENEGKTDGYSRFDHRVLDRAIEYIDKDGKKKTLMGSVGVKNELLPFVNAYFNSPNYGNAASLMFALKSLKLMGGFHIFSLEAQALAGAKGVNKIPVYNVFKGLEKIKEASTDLRLLYKHGLELKEYADRGNFIDLFEPKNTATTQLGKLGQGLGNTTKAVLRASSDFTFNIVHPAIKALTATSAFSETRLKMEKKLGRPLTEVEQSNIAKEVVKYTDRLFSGEDYRTQLLQANEWMAKYWYSPTAKRTWQTMLLSPTWQKEHIGMVKDVVLSLTTRAKEPTAYLYRRYLTGALSIYAFSNLYNYAMTKYMDGEGKTMIQNPNAFTVRAGWNAPDGRPVYLHPLKSIFEIPEFMSDPLAKAISKLAPPIQTGANIYMDIKSRQMMSPNDPRRKSDLQITSSAIQNLALPISGSKLGDKNQSIESQISSVVGLPASSQKVEKQTNLQKAGLADSKDIQAVKAQEKVVEQKRKEVLDGKADRDEYRQELKVLKELKRSQDWRDYQKFVKKQEREEKRKL